MIVVLLIAGFTILPVVVGYIKGTATYFKHTWFTIAVLFASYALISDIYNKIKKRYSQAYSRRINEIKNKNTFYRHSLCNPLALRDFNEFFFSE